MKIALKVVILAMLVATCGVAQAQSGMNPHPSRIAVLPESIMPGGPVHGGAMNGTGGRISQIFGPAGLSLFAPPFPGDGQTSNWRIINASEAGKKPWTAVGNFLVPGLGGYCSAVLVAPRIVLTANHCLYAPDYNTRDASGVPGKQLVDATRFVFVAGVHDGTFADSIPVEEVITGGWTPGTEDSAKDWAIAILTRPADSAIAPVAFKPYDPGAVAGAWRGKLVVAAYPGASFAFNTVLRFSFNCSMLRSDSANVVIHDCPSENGSSGGPILVQENGELRLIGIHSSRRHQSHVRNGVSINSFVAQLNRAVARFH